MGSKERRLALVLIVDDEEPVRDFVAMVLEDAGYRTARSIHGAQALEAMRTDRPDLVLSDVMMPVMGGVELCRRMKSEKATRTIPVVLMSSLGRRMGDGGGADAFIAKPFTLEELEALVRRWLPPEDRDVVTPSGG
jgi:CheY-like chemotaxis protein